MLSFRSLLLLLAVALAVAELGRGARVLAQGGCRPDCACGCQSRVSVQYGGPQQYAGPQVYEQRVRLPMDYQPAPYYERPPVYYYPTPGYQPPPANVPLSYPQYQPQPIVYPQYQPQYQQSYAPQPIVYERPGPNIRVDVRAPAPSVGPIRRLICGPNGCSFR